MNVPQHGVSHRNLINQLIDWDQVNNRLEHYPAIKRAFPSAKMKKCCESPPYYCHYMSWRLGTWEDESLFRRLDELLCCAETLPDWKHEQSLLNTAEFGDFWSLIWQLQVAEYLCKVGTDVRWNKSGPDLSVKVGGVRWFVECYVYRKSFGLLRFVEEVLRKIDPDVCVRYDLCLPFTLPQNTDRNKLLDNIFTPFLNSSYVNKAKAGAQVKYPMVLYQDPKSSLCIYIEGDDSDAYMPGVIPESVGDPDSYFELVLKEAVKAKMDSNKLKEHHPNLLAVNYLLSEDFQLANASQQRAQSPVLPQIAPNIDVLAVSAVGIDEQLTKDKLKIMIQSERSELASLNNHL